MRLATKLTVSLPKTTPLPSMSVPNLAKKSTISGSVSGPETISNKRMKRTGLKKWVTRKFFLKASERPSTMLVMGRPEVLEEMMAPAFMFFSTLAKTLRLISTFSTTTSITQSHSFNHSMWSSKLPQVIKSAKPSW